MIAAGEILLGNEDGGKLIKTEETTSCLRRER
jgi:hypothetical protein